MPPEDRVSVQDVLKDIRSGMSQIRLLEKYDLSPRELLRVFDKLISEKLFTMEEYKNWEAGQIQPIDETHQEKPLTLKPTHPEPPIAEAAKSSLALVYTIAMGVGITILGVLHTWALSQRSPNLTFLEGIGVIWSWAVLVAGITFSVKLKAWHPVFWSCLLWLLCLIVPVMGPLGCIWFLWFYFTELENGKIR